jgi:hypothetical protein
MSQGASSLRRVACDDAVGRHEHAISAHVGILGGEEHAHIREKATQDERSCPKMFEEQVEGGRKESGVLGLEHEVVERIGAE